MELDIRRVLKNLSTPLEGEGTLDFSGRDFPGFKVDGPVQMYWHAVAEGDSVRLEYSLQATMLAECTRCLAPVRREERLQKVYRMAPEDLAGEYPELPAGPAGGLDLEEFAYGELLMELPQVVLCAEDCKGLCPKCGKRRADCGCGGETEGDPRLAILKQLLTD